MNDCLTLQHVLHDEIPLTRTIGIRVTQCDAQGVCLSAPLEPNINHKCTAFGGSLYSIAVLCGWSFVYQQMKRHHLSGHIVIQQSEVQYALPVDGEITAICTSNDEAMLEKFITTYKRRGRARIKLQVKIVYKNQDAMTFDGQYVVHK